jgi:tetratricopeptide (TPR) repeat protein
VISRQLHDYFQQLLLYGNLANAKIVTGDWIGAMEDLAQALTLAKQLGSNNQLARNENALGFLLTRQGKLDEAMIHLSNSLELAQRHNLKALHVHILTTLADLQLRKREWQTAETMLTEVEQRALEMKAKTELPEIYSGWAQMHLAKHNLQTALEMAERSVNLARELGLKIMEGEALRVRGQALFASGRRDQAINAFETSLSILEKS